MEFNTGLNRIVYLFVLLLTFLLSNCNKKEDKNSTKNKRHDMADVYYKKARSFEKSLKLDSAYYYFHLSTEKYKAIQDSTFIVKSYFKLAKLDFCLSDYLSSEKNCVTALSYLPQNELTDHRLFIYNLMGLISKNTKKFDEAEIYFKRCRNIYLNKRDTLKYFIDYQNNLGNTYREKGDFKRSMINYNLIINIPNLKETEPSSYARALSNKAKCLLQLSRNNEALPLLVQSIKLRESINDIPGLIMSYLHLADFFSQLNKLEAKKYALYALHLCDETGDPNAKLEALYLLSKVDDLNTSKYFREYKELQDNLIKEERQFKDQTAKIRYETAQKEQQITKQEKELSQKNRSLLIGAFLFAIAVISALLFYHQKRKIKNQKTAIESQKNRIEILQRELHHRMTNNLGVIDYFINIAKANFPDKKYQTKLSELQNRMRSMFEIHKQLFKNDDITSVNAIKYIEILIHNISNAYQNSNIEIKTKISEHELITASLSFPIGIIINEFVTNSYKHAFQKDEKGEISVYLKLVNDAYELTLQDNGRGLPKDFDPNSLNSFGFESIKLLVEEYNGSFHYSGEKGVKMSIHLPKKTKYEN